MDRSAPQAGGLGVSPRISPRAGGWEEEHCIIRMEGRGAPRDTGRGVVRFLQCVSPQAAGEIDHAAFRPIHLLSRQHLLLRLSHWLYRLLPLVRLRSPPL